MRNLILYLFFLNLILVHFGQAKIHPQIEQILNKFENSNIELILARLNQQYKSEAITAAKSYQYPTLGLSTVYTKGSPFSSQLPNNNLSGYGGGNQNISQSSSLSQNNEGWSASLSSNYYIFSGYLISNGIDQANRDKKIADIRYQSDLNTKKSQYVQAILEWQWLSDTKKLIENAENAFSKVEGHKKNAQFMYTLEDESDFSEKKTYLAYQKVKVLEALKLVEEFLLTTLPEVNIEQISRLPHIAIQYKIPSEANIDSLYKNQSLTQKSLAIEVENAEGIQKVVSWQKPYVPNVLLTGGVSRSGTPDESSDETNWSAQLVVSFNFFDGFASSARAQQANIGVKTAKLQQQLESEKKLLFLKHQMMKSKVSFAEFNHKNSIVKQKELRLSDVKRKYNQGVATSLEMTLATVDLTKAKGDAYDALKNHQEANLSIASELNEWEKVEIYANE